MTENKEKVTENKDFDQKNLMRFFSIAFAFSWIIWGVAVVITNFTDIDIPSAILGIIIIGAFGPSGAAVWLTYKNSGKEAAKKFLKRGVQIKIIPLWVWVAMFLVPAMAWAGAMFFISLNQEVSFDFQALLFFLPMVIVMILGGPLQEEYGWRGYALDRLQKRWNALISSIILAVIWSTWHLPLFFIAGSAQQSLNVGMFYISELGISILMTWLHNNSKASIFVALLFHSIINSMGDLFILGDGGYNAYAISQLAIAFVVVIIWGPKTLSRAKQAVL